MEGAGWNDSAEMVIPGLRLHLPGAGGCGQRDCRAEAGGFVDDELELRAVDTRMVGLAPLFTPGLGFWLGPHTVFVWSPPLRGVLMK